MAKNPRLGKLLNSRLEKLLTEKYLEEEAKERAEGKIEGRAEARAEALAAMRGVILKLLRLRFPRLVGKAWNAIDEINSVETLAQLLAKFAVASDEETARSALEAHTQQQ